MRGNNQPTALFDQHAARPAFSQGKWLTFRGVTVGGLGWGMSQPTFGERAFLTIDAEPTSFRGKRQVTQFKSGRLFICYNFVHRAAVLSTYSTPSAEEITSPHSPTT